MIEIAKSLIPVTVSDFWVREHIADATERRWALNFLARLCEIDTSLRSDMGSLRIAEHKCLYMFNDSIEEYVAQTHDCEFVPINPRIVEDSYYTWPHYAGSNFQNFDYVYKDRKNLVVSQKDVVADRHRWLLHAHVDTVPPHLPIRATARGLAGRGTVDDKAGMVVIALVMRWMNALRKTALDVEFPPVDIAITIDEEAGGNGSLSVALDLDEGPLTVIVLEPTKLKPHPANRGALWFQIQLNPVSSVSDHDATCVAAEMIKEIFLEGLRLKSEGVHPLFLPSHVQTCIGIWNHWGVFPSAACRRVEFLFELLGAERVESGELKNRLTELMNEQALKHDLIVKKGITDVQRVGSAKHPTYRVVIEALDGHMGSLSRDTDAAIKAAFLISAIAETKMGFVHWPEVTSFHIEGGQGFTPSHTLPGIADRIKRACRTGHHRGCMNQGLASEGILFQVDFKKIHNEAYCSDMDGQGSVFMSEAAASLCDFDGMRELLGWEASCDARIYAKHCQDVITFGPGSLDLAHGMNEHIDIAEIMSAAGIILHALLRSG